MDRKWISRSLWACVLAAGLTAIGCQQDQIPGVNLRPGPTKTSGGEEIKELNTGPGPEIYAAIKAAEEARVNYRYRLTILQSYYTRVGNMEKLGWANDELRNLNTAQWFTWKGLEYIPAPAEDVSNADEVLLVDYVVTARKAWIDAMGKVAALYDANTLTRQAEAVRTAVRRLEPEHCFTYFTSADIPPETLRPTQSSPEANALYDKAFKLYKEGHWFLIPGAFTRYDKEREALNLFRKLIHDHPDSDKIALSAYRIGEIEKEYFHNYTLAVRWYERAWQWDPKIDQPARFEAGVVYDMHLQDRENAVRCFRLCLKYDPYRVGNFEHARSKIKEYTGMSE
ncbi:MAG: tol-pal system YbgF family protein [Phycisphaerae bacterium]